MPRDPDDPLEAMLDFSGPTDEPDDPVLARLFPTAYPEDPEAAGEFRRFTEGTLRDGKAAAAIAIIDALEEAGLPPELTEDGLVIDVELDEDAGRAWARSLHRSPARPGDPARGGGGRRGLLGLAARRRPPRSGPRHLPVGGLPPGDPGRGADVLMPIPEFIVEIRQMIGQHEMWLPGVTAVVTRGPVDDQ